MITSSIVYINKNYSLRGYAGYGNISNILKNVKKYYLKNIKYSLLYISYICIYIYIYIYIYI